MPTKAVRLTMPLVGEANPAGYLVMVPGASVLIRQNGVALVGSAGPGTPAVFSDNDKTPMTNPVPTGVAPGTAGVDTDGRLLVYLNPGSGYDVQATVGTAVSTAPLPDVSADIADVADAADLTALEATVATKVDVPAGIADGEVPVWNADTQEWDAGTGGAETAAALPVTVAGLVATNTEAAIAETLGQQSLQVEPGSPTPVELQGSVSAIVWADATPLAGGASVTFPTSGRLDVASPTKDDGRWAALIGTIDTDQDGTLFLDWYVSEVGGLIRTDSIPVTGGTPEAVHVNVPHTHLVIRLVNGATPQTRLEANLSGTAVPEPQGPQGEQGPAGATGETGPAGAPGITHQFLAADVSLPDTTLVTLFTLPVLNGERYALDLALSYTGDAAADIALRVTCPGGSTARFWSLRPAAGAANTNAPAWLPHASGDSVTCGAMGGTTEAPVWTRGTLTAGADGNVIVQAAQAATHATPSVIKRPGSYAQWSKML